MAEKPVYVPFFEDMFEALDCLDDDNLRLALRMIRAYAFDGEEPTEKGPAKAVFLGFKGSMDATASKRKRNQRVARNRWAGRNADEGDTTEHQDGTTEHQEGTSEYHTDTKAHQDGTTEYQGVLIEYQKVPEGTSEYQKVPEVYQNVPDGYQSVPSEYQKVPKGTDQRPRTKDQGPKTKDLGPRTKDQGKPKGQNTAPSAPYVSRHPPTFEEWWERWQERGREKGVPVNEAEAEEAYAFYGANGWRQANGNPLKSWKLGLVTCFGKAHPELRDRASPGPAEPDPLDAYSAEAMMRKGA